MTRTIETEYARLQNCDDFSFGRPGPRDPLEVAASDWADQASDGGRRNYNILVNSFRHGARARMDVLAWTESPEYIEGHAAGAAYAA